MHNYRSAAQGTLACTHARRKQLTKPPREAVDAECFPLRSRVPEAASQPRRLHYRTSKTICFQMYLVLGDCLRHDKYACFQDWSPVLCRPAVLPGSSASPCVSFASLRPTLLSSTLFLIPPQLLNANHQLRTLCPPFSFSLALSPTTRNVFVCTRTGSPAPRTSLFVLLRCKHTNDVSCPHHLCPLAMKRHVIGAIPPCVLEDDFWPSWVRSQEERGVHHLPSRQKPTPFLPPVHQQPRSRDPLPPPPISHSARLHKDFQTKPKK